VVAARPEVELPAGIERRSTAIESSLVVTIGAEAERSDGLSP
jgi:hypothetical protein